MFETFMKIWIIPIPNIDAHTYKKLRIPLSEFLTPSDPSEQEQNEIDLNKQIVELNLSDFKTIELIEFFSQLKIFRDCMKSIELAWQSISKIKIDGDILLPILIKTIPDRPILLKKINKKLQSIDEILLKFESQSFISFSVISLLTACKFKINVYDGDEEPLKDEELTNDILQCVKKLKDDNNTTKHEKNNIFLLLQNCGHYKNELKSLILDTSWFAISEIKKQSCLVRYQRLIELEKILTDMPIPHAIRLQGFKKYFKYHENIFKDHSAGKNFSNDITSLIPSYQIKLEKNFSMFTPKPEIKKKVSTPYRNKI